LFLTAGERLQSREAELAQYQVQIKQLEIQKTRLLVDITPEALALFLKTWRSKIETTRQKQDIIALRNLLFPRFLTKVALGYNTARLWYSFPLDPIADSAGRTVTTFAAPQAQTRRRIKNGPSERDLEIFARHKKVRW